jgi:hypothetical protein
VAPALSAPEPDFFPFNVENLTIRNHYFIQPDYSQSLKDRVSGLLLISSQQKAEVVSAKG